MSACVYVRSFQQLNRNCVPSGSSTAYFIQHNTRCIMAHTNKISNSNPNSIPMAKAKPKYNRMPCHLLDFDTIPILIISKQRQKKRFSMLSTISQTNIYIIFHFKRILCCTSVFAHAQLWTESIGL